MGNLSFVLHCLDGGVVASDMWAWPNAGEPTDILPVGSSACVIVHGPEFETGLELWKSWGLSNVSTSDPTPTVVGKIVEKVGAFAVERKSKGMKVPLFAYLLAGYFGDHPDLRKLNISSVNPTEVTGFAHNVFNGQNDVARALDQKLPPRSLTVDSGLYVAAFWILQSHSVYFETVGTRFALGVIDRADGLKWTEVDVLRQIQKVVANGGRAWSRASLSLFQDEWRSQESQNR